MDSAPLRHEVLHEDLQIVCVTLATITEDVRRHSARAAEAIEEALVKLDRARAEFSRDGRNSP